MSDAEIAAGRPFALPPAIKCLVAAQKKLRDHYESATKGRLEFTFDGNLVGDIGEALAVELFGLDLTQSKSSEGVDGTAPDKRTVQVKTTGTGRGPAFRKTKLDAQQLLVFSIDFGGCCATLVYNGPEYPVRDVLPSTWTGQRSVSMKALKDLNESLSASERLPLTRPPVWL